ncbi:guanylate kinase [Deinobacterium chartae]|uniref:Guanylate kinase n=1 Tax=Deinobacterium chartae TaxID=521158 RepID=A0A841HZV2_9DEIO|nr:guanylate kinase [Deinobacterium chartae]MBB6098927.1 guanylate kinase [Deinobacterium chartae]
MAPEASPTPRGLLFVMTGASGVGKGTIRARLLERVPMFYSISWTTREQRPGEVDGVDYHFRTREQFEAELLTGAGFLEHAEFVGNRYGTPRAPVEAALARGEHALLEIEVEGAMQVAAAAPEAVLIFIMPPSLSELRRRLVGRATETPERIERRLARAREEILAAHRFRYVVVNDRVERAVADLEALIRAEELRSTRWPQSELEGVISN